MFYQEMHGHRHRYKTYPMVGRESGMEINNHYSQFPHKDINHISGHILNHHHEVAPVMGGPPNQELEQQLIGLKHQYQVQQQILLQQFQQQQHQLAAEHEKQISGHIQMLMIKKQQEFLEQQQQIEEQQRLQKERIEQERLEQIKNKKKDEESAVASSEVKQKLAEFVLKKKRDQASSATNSPPQYRHWAAAHHRSLEQHSPPQSGMSPPYRPHLLDSFQLRKTASEPNLKLRSALKQKVLERRGSPLLRCKDRGPFAVKRKPPLLIDTTLCNSDNSSPNSPPSSGQVSTDTCSTHSQEEVGMAPIQLMQGMVGQTSPDVSSLYTSLPNISQMTKPSASPPESARLSMTNTCSEAELRAMAAHRYGLPLTGHMLPNTLPFYHPSLPVIDGEFTPPTSPAYLASQMKALEEAQAAGKIPQGPLMGSPNSSLSGGSGGIADTQVARHRMHRQRPLGRTQSAPLPLGHPLLQPQNLLLQQQKHEQFVKDSQKLYLKQRIHQTVLQRSGSKGHMENVDEETEARLAQEMKESRDQDDDDVVLVKESRVTGGQLPPPHLQAVATDHPLPLHLQRSAGSYDQREGIKARHMTSPPSASHPRPLARTLSSPLVTYSLSPQASPDGASVSQPVRFTTGLAYDSQMLKHQCTCGDNASHPEHAGRLHSIWARLHETGLICRCEKVKVRKATIEELQTCHSEAYALLYGTNPFHRKNLDPKLLESLSTRFCLLPCGGIGVDSDTVWNDHYTPSAARMAVGCVIELAFKVASGELKNGMALVRPPGHHAEHSLPMGFCYFNSVAIAAKLLKEKMSMERILIVDWDVHHGNSTQQVFYSDRQTLVISLHRHDNGNFFPGTGAPEEVGEEEGQGYNVNVAWTGDLNPPMGDAEYMAAFRSVVMPIAREFSPQIVLVSAGYAGAGGHPPQLGGYSISPECFGHMTRQLMTLAEGKLVLALEGGYDLTAICDSSEMCVQALLEDEIPPLKDEEMCRSPCKPAIETLKNIISIQGVYWPCIKKYSSTLGLPLLEAQRREREEVDTVKAMASLTMVPENAATTSSTPQAPPVSASETTDQPMEES